MSAPATNALAPAPVRMTPRIAASVSIRVTASPSSAMTVAFSAFSLSGRLTVTRAMPSRDSKSRVEKVMVGTGSCGIGAIMSSRAKRGILPGNGSMPRGEDPRFAREATGLVSFQHANSHPIAWISDRHRPHSRPDAAPRRGALPRPGFGGGGRRGDPDAAGARRAADRHRRGDGGSAWTRRGHGATWSACAYACGRPRRHAAHGGQPSLGARPDGAAGRAGVCGR